MPPSKNPPPDEIPENILHAARERSTMYSFNKTTMAEIAKDCDMSAANLYRFYENKLDINLDINRVHARNKLYCYEIDCLIDLFETHPQFPETHETCAQSD